jgi:hypothetical protein
MQRQRPGQAMPHVPPQFQQLVEELIAPIIAGPGHSATRGHELVHVALHLGTLRACIFQTRQIFA